MSQYYVDSTNVESIDIDDLVKKQKLKSTADPDYSKLNTDVTGAVVDTSASDDFPTKANKKVSFAEDDDLTKEGRSDSVAIENRKRTVSIRYIFFFFK